MTDHLHRLATIFVRAGHQGEEGGNGGHGNNDQLVVTGPALPAGTLLGGNGGPGRPGGGAGPANSGALTGDVTAFDGTVGPTLP
ncbi:hypothetical protein [Streptomyces sp. NPDC058394]|uniref:hypothetical protein n=1 Tax=Streptomyces sp. NPDC058394 TaxID=3346477 RepID=UPI00366A2DA7